MINWTDRKYVNPRKRVFKNMETEEILNLEVQEDLQNIETESETPLNAEMLNLAQQELKQDTLDEVDEKISNLETLPTGGTTGQVLSKASDANGDAEWCNIEANEVHIGSVDTAPDSAKLIIENDDVEEEETLGNQIQTITNENGTAIKFPDGTMICTTARREGTYDGSNLTYMADWTYPVPFISVPIVTGNVDGGNACAYTVLIGALETKATIQTKCLGVNGTMQACDRSASCIAVGRWK